MSETPTLPPEVIEAFHLLWKLFPGPVTLVHKSRQVMAANPAARLLGREPGVKCSQMPPLEAHKGCLGNSALSEQVAKYVRMKTPEIDRMVFWVPIQGYSEYFLHFSTPITNE